MNYDTVAPLAGAHDGCRVRSPKQLYSRPGAGRSHSPIKPFTQVSSAQPERLLGTIGISAVPPTQKAEKAEVITAQEAAEFVKYWRNKLFEFRTTIGDFYDTVRPCGRYPRKKGEDIAVVRSIGGSVYYTNLQQCKSRWACPICSMKIAKHRADEVREMLTSAVEVHGQVGVMITVTLPHYSNEKLQYLGKQVRDAFRGITADNQYKGKYKLKNGVYALVTDGLKQQYGVMGFVKALEVKKSRKHGWHPHLHVCFMMRPKRDAKAEIEAAVEAVIKAGDVKAGLSAEVAAKIEAEVAAEVEAVKAEIEAEIEAAVEADIKAFSEKIIALWSKHVKKVTGKTLDEGVQHWTPITNIKGISDYTTKWDLARELVESNKKDSQDDKSGFPVFKLVELFQETGDMQYMDDFLVFAKAMKNARPVTYSDDFKLLCLSTPDNWTPEQKAAYDGEKKDTEEKTDAEICEQEEDIEKLLMSLAGEVYKEIRRQKQEANLLNVAQFEPERLLGFVQERIPGVVNVADAGSPPKLRMS